MQPWLLYTKRIKYTTLHIHDDFLCLWTDIASTHAHSNHVAVSFWAISLALTLAIGALGYKNPIFIRITYIRVYYRMCDGIQSDVQFMDHGLSDRGPKIEMNERKLPALWLCN